jgi:hypothetical protein
MVSKCKVKVFNSDGDLISKEDGTLSEIAIISGDFFYAGDRIEIVESSDDDSLMKAVARKDTKAINTFEKISKNGGIIRIM